jgi:hypothetical protein
VITKRGGTQTTKRKPAATKPLVVKKLDRAVKDLTALASELDGIGQVDAMTAKQRQQIETQLKAAAEHFVKSGNRVITMLAKTGGPRHRLRRLYPRHRRRRGVLEND